MLDATNDIFRRVMCEAVGDLDYTDREALYVGADYPEPGDPRYKTEVLLLDTSGKLSAMMICAEMRRRPIKHPQKPSWSPGASGGCWTRASRSMTAGRGYSVRPRRAMW